MSLLNDVLRDLDRRRQGRRDETPSALDGLQPTPEGPEGAARTRVIFAVALAVTIVAAVVSEGPRGDAPVLPQQDPTTGLPVVAARPPAGAAAIDPIDPIGPIDPIREAEAAATEVPAVTGAPTVTLGAATLGVGVGEAVERRAPAARRTVPRWAREPEDIARPIEIRSPGFSEATAVPGRARVHGSDGSDGPGADADAGARAPADEPPLAPKLVPEDLYRAGLEHAAAGYTASAETSLRECLSLDPHHVGARQALATLLARNGRSDAAYALLEGGRRLAEDGRAFALLEARIRAEHDDPEGALALLEAEAGPGVEADALRAALYQQTGRHAAAAQGYSALVRHDASQASWWMGLGISLEALGEAGPALAAYQHAQQATGLDGAARTWVRDRVEILAREARRQAVAPRGPEKSEKPERARSGDGRRGTGRR